MVQSINRSRPPEEVAQQLSLSRLIADQQKAISTGQRVDRPSDDPQAWLEISTLARFQSNEAAWTSNVGRAETRATQAEASLTAITDGLIRARELLIQASTGTTTAQDREGLALELDGILNDFNDVLAQRDNFGGPLFGDGPPIRIPIGEERYVIAAPNLAQVTQGIDIGGGNVSTLQQIIVDMADAIRNGTDADRTAQFSSASGAIDHITGLLTKQGVARNSLEATKEQLGESRLALAERRSQLEDVDATEAITRLQTLLTSLEAAQAVYGRVSQRTLLDYLG
ncbi:MAG: flagellin [Blastomonas sp.]